MNEESQKKIKVLMCEYFGKDGILVLLSAVKNIGLKNIVNLSEEEKQLLIDYLVDRVFSTVVSLNRMPMIRVRLQSIFE